MQMTTYEPGDRVLVRLGSGREHEAEVIVDRVERVRVLIDGDRATVLKSRVRRVPERVVPPFPPVDGSTLWSDAVARADVLPAPLRERIAALHAVPKAPKPWRSEAYRHFVRERGVCCCCGGSQSFNDPIVAHHHGPHAMSQKTDDTRCIPLLDSCHRYFHTHGTFRGVRRSVALVVGDDVQPLTREGTDRLAAREQARLLTDYCHLSGIDVDNIIVEALTAALREEG